MNDLVRCPVCHHENGGHDVFQGYRNNADYRVRCGVCGDFDVSREALTDFLENGLEQSRLTPLRRAALSYLVRGRQTPGGEFSMLKTDDVLRALRDDIALPSPPAQAARALELIAAEVRRTGKPLKHVPEHLYASIGAPNRNASAHIVGQLIVRGLLDGIDVSSNDGDGFIEIEPTLDGWEKLEAEQPTQHIPSAATAQNGPPQPPAIIVLKFNRPDIDAFVDNVVKPAVAEAGHVLERVNESPRIGLIDLVMKQKLAAAPFVIAELTHHNNGAYWEAGFAEGRDVPVIYICREAEWNDGASHFDTNHHETIIWQDDQPDAFRARLLLLLGNSQLTRAPTIST